MSQQQTNSESLIDMVRCSLCKAFSHLTKDCPKVRFKTEQTELEQDFEFYKYLKELESKNNKLVDVKQIKTSGENTNFVTQTNESGTIKTLKNN